MTNAGTWVYVVVAVVIAGVANSVSAVWASGDNRFSFWLLAMILISPVVFITFGLVAARTGLAVAAGTVDALLTAGTILIGLFVFREWSKTTAVQYVGMAFSLIGICLMLFGRK